MTKLTEELIANIKKLRKEGKTYLQIADMLGVSKTSACKYGKIPKENGITTIKRAVVKADKSKKLSRKQRKEQKRLRKR